MNYTTNMSYDEVLTQVLTDLDLDIFERGIVEDALNEPNEELVEKRQEVESDLYNLEDELAAFKTKFNDLLIKVRTDDELTDEMILTELEQLQTEIPE